MDLRFSSVSLVCLVFLGIGFLSAPSDEYQNGTTPDFSMDKPDSLTWADNAGVMSMVKRQEMAQQTFQTKIQDLHHPKHCREARRLVVQKPKSSAAAVGANRLEQLAREFHYLSLSLQVAVATGRTLVLQDDWALLPDVIKECDSWELKLPTSESHASTTRLRRISCLKDAVNSKCGQNGLSAASGRDSSSWTSVDSSLGFGIIPGQVIDEHNSLFHADFYGPQSTIDMPGWPYPKSSYLVDVVPGWERSWGRFWIRSQMVHYLWEHWHGTAFQSSSSSLSISQQSTPSIAFYCMSSKKMRKNLAAKFGRNATRTQDFGRYMEIANTILNEHPTMDIPKTIYLITDDQNDGAIPNNYLRREWADWRFVKLFGPNELVGGGDMMNNNDDNEKQVVASLAVMREATFLVGSFQSQLFRLAVELNAARLSSVYPVTMRRHWTVDVEWFENP